MDPRIVVLLDKKLVGKSLRMSLANDKTVDLWQSFMPERKLIQHTVDSRFYSIQVYDDNLDFSEFNPQTEFTKCAMVEISRFENIPDSMETRVLSGGLYAVFIHKGPAKKFAKTSRYIFTQWLPNSEYVLDKRPHFELIDERYKPHDEDSEEEVWIPIKKK